ncbi:MAG TPA: nuclear transport factor 2 family protein [Candidatus Limnocylindria bacterium]|nr:nuclear transport factor 2 family protein [Candidatus Limnocylindria bacterium]
MTEPLDERIAAVAGLHDGARLSRTGLFDLLAEDVEWWVAGPPDAFAWAGTFHGHDGVRRWADALNAAMDYTRFELLEIFGAGDTVVEIIGAGGTAHATGRPFESEVVRIWTFRGRSAVRVRSFYDTSAYAEALAGEKRDSGDSPARLDRGLPGARLLRDACPGIFPKGARSIGAHLSRHPDTMRYGASDDRVVHLASPT